ncbi:MFS transporter [Hyphomicrobium sp.]|uniref:MFS transporter n=1 Tax=Hyphomicrobium sp. TaxID=82 RepID=UPI0025C30C0A|nr:MFS transporter [Hyphomicrobium sp.]MCC7252142.1 MFS transporter [Hyphomicrobium sp.]
MGASPFAIFLIFLCGYTLSQFYRSFLAVLAPELANEFALSSADLGNMSSAWFTAFAVMQLPIGLAFDRLGPRRCVSVLMLVGALGAAVFALAQSGRDLILAMALIGIGCAPIYVAALFMFGRAYPPQHFALLSSWMIGIGSAGNLLGATPLALAAQAFGWRSVFFGLALATLLVAALVAKCITDPPPASGAPSKASGWLAELKELLVLRDLWFFVPMLIVSYGIVAAERGVWMGPFLADVYGLDQIARGNAALLMGAAMCVGAMAYGPLDQWFGARKPIVVAGTFMTAACFLALWHWPARTLATTIVLLTLIGLIGLTWGVLMAHARSFFPEHLLGRGITLANFLCMAGAGAIQAFSGARVDALKAATDAETAYASLHVTFGLVLLASGALYLLSSETSRTSRDDGT